MDKELQAYLNDLPYDLLVDIIERKLVAKGITLNERQQDTLLGELKRQEFSDLKVRLRGASNNHKVAVRLTDTDISELENEANHLLDNLPDTILSIAANLAPTLMNDLDGKWKGENRGQNRNQKKFSKSLNRLWGETLNQLKQIIVVCSDLGGIVNGRLRGQEPVSNPFTVEVQTRLHAKACYVSREITTLLSAGLAEGAIARWRTLHEIAVTSFFIDDNEDLAERYFFHEEVESLRAARQYNEHADRLGFEPITDAQLADMEAIVDELKRRFGKEYSKTYGWAANALRNPNRNLTFNEIEKATDLDHFRPYYRLASHNVHGNPKGVFFRLGLIDQDEFLLAGPSVYDLADPIQNSAISLNQITAHLVTLNPTLDDIVTLKALSLMVYRIQDTLMRVESSDV